MVFGAAQQDKNIGGSQREISMLQPANLDWQEPLYS